MKSKNERMTDMKTAVEKTLATSSFATPDCFDPTFLNYSFDPNTILDYEQNQQKGLMQMYKLRTDVISNICCASYHLLPGMLSQQGFLNTREGQGFIENLQWFLGTSLEFLKSLPPTPTGSEDVRLYTLSCYSQL